MRIEKEFGRWGEDSGGFLKKSKILQNETVKKTIIEVVDKTMQRFVFEAFTESVLQDMKRELFEAFQILKDFIDVISIEIDFSLSSESALISIDYAYKNGMFQLTS